MSYWSRDWQDVFHTAQFRAWATGRRYKVWFEPNNKWWTATELIERYKC